MSDSLPLEVKTLTAVLERMQEGANAANPTIRTLSRFMQEVAGTSEVESISTLFHYLKVVDGLIQEHMVSPGGKRSGERLRARLAKLFDGNILGDPFGNFHATQSHNIQAILDLIPMLDDIQFDNDGLISKRPEIAASIEALLSDVAGSSELAEATKRVVVAQIDLIRRTLDRFEISGVVPFRESIYCSIGRLTLELKDLNEAEAGKVRKVIDDIVRIKDLAELAGGTLRLAGPFIAGYLAAPVGL